jgi:molybdenum cofactor cytidylyltransferase
VEALPASGRAAGTGSGGPCVLVLASGAGRRFRAAGGTTHKLEAPLAGRPVLAHVLDAVARSGLRWHLERGPHPGMGDAIAAAVRATADADGWLVLPADLPLIEPDTLRRVATAAPADGAARACWQERPGHPVRFPASWRERLLALAGEAGAAALLREHGWLPVPVDDPGCVLDVDTPEDLQALERLYWARRHGTAPQRP